MNAFTKILLASTLSISVAGCEVLPDNAISRACAGENAPLCLAIVLIGGGLAIGAFAGGGVLYPYLIHSDARLKTDMKHYQTLDNGIRVYSYRYKGDDTIYLGAVAQELLRNKTFAKAVSKDKDGFYMVDYAKLGLKIKNGAAMMRDGKAAEQRALR